MSTLTDGTSADNLEERLDKLTEKVTNLENQIKRMATNQQAMHNRLKKIGVMQKVNFSG